MNKARCYDLAFLGHYTKDTIITASQTKVVDGGGFNYGAHAAVRMGLKVAAVTQLAQEDFRVIEELKKLGVDVFARATDKSTCLRLEYSPSNVDERIIYVTSWAGPFTVAEVKDLRAKAFIVTASMRSEVPLEVIEELAKKDSLLAADIQSFIRTNQAGKLAYEAWPEKQEVLKRFDVLKTDAVEAELLTGKTDIKTAARLMTELGPKEIVLTHQGGVLVYAGDKFYETGFFPKQLVGRSGRGDTCLASYVTKRLTAPPAEAAIWAAAVTSLKMEAEGPFRRTISEVEDLIREKYEKSSVNRA